MKSLEQLEVRQAAMRARQQTAARLRRRRIALKRPRHSEPLEVRQAAMRVRQQALHVIVCKRCGKEKQTVQPHTTFCSRTCQKAFSRSGGKLKDWTKPASSGFTTIRVGDYLGYRRVIAKKEQSKFPGAPPRVFFQLECMCGHKIWRWAQRISRDKLMSKGWECPRCAGHRIAFRLQNPGLTENEIQSMMADAIETRWLEEAATAASPLVKEYQRKQVEEKRLAGLTKICATCSTSFVSSIRKVYCSEKCERRGAQTRQNERRRRNGRRRQAASNRSREIDAPM